MDWLAFSLSSQRRLLHAAFAPSPRDPHHGVVAAAEEGTDGPGSGAVDQMMLTAASCGPKVEDFLGGCLVGEPERRPLGGAADPDPDLKSIAAGFLRDFPADQREPDIGAIAAAVTAAAVVETRKAGDRFGRTSVYRGVTRQHRWTGRYEAHLWDNSCLREGQSRKGRQGGYDKEEKAARAYDLAALKYWGPTTITNFPVPNYVREMEEMKNVTRQEFVASLRRKSSGFSRGASMYRGVTRHHQHGRWQARIGRVAGNKDLYLGTFSTQEEAAEAYDVAAIKFRGLNAVTNFDISRYDVDSIVANNLPIGGKAGRTPKAASDFSSTSSSDATAAKPIDIRDPDSPPPPFAVATAPGQTQQHQDYCRPLLALTELQQQSQHRASDQSSSPSFFVYPSAVIIDFSSAMASLVGQDTGSLSLNSGIVQHHQQQLQEGQVNVFSIPYATPMAVGNSSYEAAGHGGGCVTRIASPMHACEPVAETSLGFFQTPIFGVE
ncbi:hypothetical protein Taro_013856 [Colocasia esculenta]|uniref:AP2/ERF domain-containing protein n=1 Tax=Colocasia esculenta TaxID=4460 RepID=A0A843UK29_COLES|nr:hypothetical protein [Colocasia esculenta]